MKYNYGLIVSSFRTKDPIYDYLGGATVATMFGNYALICGHCSGGKGIRLDPTWKDILCNIITQVGSGRNLYQLLNVIDVDPKATTGNIILGSE